MRKILVSIIFTIAFASFSKAQFVTIPDSNFAVLLQGFVGSCIIGNQLDTTCQAVLNRSTLVFGNSKITNLTGIQYFKNLEILICPDTLVDFIPALPPNLITLNCVYNHLTSFPPLPQTLTILNCEHNWLDSLPTLPASLTTLYCFNNHLRYLPALPQSLTSIDCSNNLLTNIPTLPTELKYLDCSLNQITNLPSLPDSLIYLVCSNNQLNTIPTLPDSLILFNCSYNRQLICLPELGIIGNLNFDSTAIHCLPDTDNIQSSAPPLSSVPLCRSFNPNGCSATGLNEIKSSNTFRCYPSPTSGSFTIDMTGYGGGDKQISIYDQLGQLVYQTHTSLDKLQVMDKLSSGIYTVSVTQDSRREYARVVVE